MSKIPKLTHIFRSQQPESETRIEVREVGAETNKIELDVPETNSDVNDDHLLTFVQLCNCKGFQFFLTF